MLRVFFHFLFSHCFSFVCLSSSNLIRAENNFLKKGCTVKWRRNIYFHFVRARQLNKTHTQTLYAQLSRLFSTTLGGSFFFLRQFRSCANLMRLKSKPFKRLFIVLDWYNSMLCVMLVAKQNERKRKNDKAGGGVSTSCKKQSVFESWSS